MGKCKKNSKINGNGKTPNAKANFPAKAMVEKSEAVYTTILDNIHKERASDAEKKRRLAGRPLLLQRTRVPSRSSDNNESNRTEIGTFMTVVARVNFVTLR